MSAADVEAVFHDPRDGRTRYDSTRTSESEWRVECGCGHQSWGFSEEAAETAHRRHRRERAEALALAVALLNGATATDHTEEGG